MATITEVATAEVVEVEATAIKPEVAATEAATTSIVATL